MQGRKEMIEMRISDTIALLIEQMLNDGGGTAELKRNDLAEKLGCVPSQINYVITSRFTPDRGYIIESRRGGGGYVRIIKKQMGRNEYLMHLFHAVGTEIDKRAAEAFTADMKARGLITPREEKMIDTASGYVGKDSERSDMLRQIILTVME